LSRLKPARRRQAAWRPFKGPVYGCMMCGNCLLQETAIICPIEFPKGARNGPCGGSTPEHILERLEKADDDSKEEGFQITLELIDQIGGMEGANGFHLMPVMWESIVPRIDTEAGLLPPDFDAPQNHDELITGV